MKIKLWGFGVSLEPLCSGGAAGVPVFHCWYLTFYWRWYNLRNKEMVPGWWWRTRSFWFLNRPATPMERLEYMIKSNEQRRELGMPELWDWESA